MTLRKRGSTGNWKRGKGGSEGKTKKKMVAATGWPWKRERVLEIESGGRVEVKVRRRRRCKQLLDDLENERGGTGNCKRWKGRSEGKTKKKMWAATGWPWKREVGCWKLKEEELDRAVRRTGFGGGYGSVLRQTAEWMKYELNYLTRFAYFSKVRRCWVVFLPYTVLVALTIGTWKVE